MKIATRTRPSTRCWTKLFSMLPAVNVAITSGRMKNRPIPSTAVMPSISATPPLPSSTPSSSAWRLAERISQRVPDDELLVQDHQAPDERPLRGGMAVDGAGVEALVLEHDPAVGMAKSDREAVAAAHHDALDERLAAVVEAGHALKSTG